MAIQCSPGSPLLSVLIMQHSKTTNSIFGSFFFFGNNILFLMCKFKCRCRSCRGAVMQCDILMKLMFTKLIYNVKAIDFTRSSCSIYPRFEDQQHGRQLATSCSNKTGPTAHVCKTPTRRGTPGNRQPTTLQGFLRNILPFLDRTISTKLHKQKKHYEKKRFGFKTS